MNSDSLTDFIDLDERRRDLVNISIQYGRLKCNCLAAIFKHFLKLSSSRRSHGVQNGLKI